MQRSGRIAIADIQVNDKGARSTVMIAIHAIPDQIVQLDKRLRVALMGLEFQVRTEMQDLEVKA